jgi:hypothetical protein
MSTLRKLISMLAAYTTDGGTGSLLDTAGDIAVIDVRHMTNIEIFVNQTTDAGTCTIDVERTIDGVNWDPVGQFTEASFPAGNNMAQSLLLVDANGMPLLATQVRVTLSAVAGGGGYTCQAYGFALAPNERLIVDTGTYGPDADEDGLLEVAAEAVTFSAKGLTNIEVLVNQVVDPGVGTCSIVVERSVDGVHWDLISTLTDASFTEGATNLAVPVSFSGTGGRPLHAELIRVRLAAISAGGSWSAALVGIQTPGYR